MPAAPIVRCCQCDKSWRATHKGVLYRRADKRYWCADQAACERRRAALLQLMQDALNFCWHVLDQVMPATSAALREQGLDELAPKVTPGISDTLREAGHQ